MPDYSKGKIYKITSSNGLPYIGSTIQQLSKRMAHHRERKTCSSIIHLDCEDCQITLIELYPCNSKEELNMRERYYIENMECCNKHMPIISVEEKLNYKKNYRIKNADKIKEYRKNNLEKIKEHKKQFYEENKEKILLITKEYRIKNADKIALRQKEYRKNNADKIKERRSQKIMCSCGVEYTKCHKNRHLQSQYHINNCKEIDDE